MCRTADAPTLGAMYGSTEAGCASPLDPLPAVLSSGPRYFSHILRSAAYALCPTPNP